MIKTERPAAKRKSNQPITAHRLFPAMVALWFAALFGLGSFAMSPSFLEGIVTSVGLPALVPATTPPLGFTARALVALAMTVLGGGIGLFIALRLRPAVEVTTRRRFATGKAAAREDVAPKVRARDAHPDAPPRKPLVLTEDLVDAADDMPPIDGMPLRRRALSVTDETGTEVTGPAETFAYAPPLGVPAVEEPVEMPFAEAEVVEDVPIVGLPPAMEAEPEIDSLSDSLDTPEPDPEIAAAPVYAEPAPIAAVAAAIAAREPVAQRSPVADAPLETLGLVQLIERLALAIADRRKSDDIEGEPLPPFMIPAATVEPAPLPEPEAQPAFTPPAPSVPFGIARFQSEAARPRPPFATATALIDDNDDDGAGVIVPRFLGLAIAAPLESEAFVDDTPVVETFASLPAVSADDAEPPVPEDRYPSLVDMAVPPPRQDFVRIEGADAPETAIEPVVIFPGQGPRAVESYPAESHGAESDRAPFARPAASPVATQQAFVPPASALPDPAEADLALRAALATLQRMTAKG
ncbi:MAG: hypothetical protein B7Z39_02220 [Novosphingobium sp. 12-64-8]|nr:MAG: hypothetical protein B7Z39_02220 [Novosphingobium sp. 12-64-8]